MGPCLQIVGFVCLGILLWIVIIAIFIGLDRDLRHGWTLEAELLSRAPVSDDEFVRQYFPDGKISADVLVSVRRMLANEMDYPADQLLPDDYFKHFWEEWDAGHLVKALQARFGIVISKKDLQATRPTVRQLSELIQRLHLEQAPK